MSAEGMAARLDFVIGGVQKAGTSALAAALATDPRIRLPVDKEAHVFDAADYPGQQAAEEGYARILGPYEPGVLYGDATPIYLAHPTFIARACAYNPKLKWIVLLRNPVDRAISNYHMEFDWGRERRCLWLALLLERWRLWRRWQDFSHDAPLRRAAYAWRGDYARQLQALLRYFPAEQVLLIDSGWMAARPAEVLGRVYAFLGLPLPEVGLRIERVREGGYPALPERGLHRRLLELWMFRSLRRQKRDFGIDWQAPLGRRVPDRPGKAVRGE